MWVSYYLFQKWPIQTIRGNSKVQLMSSTYQLYPLTISVHLDSCLMIPVNILNFRQPWFLLIILNFRQPWSPISIINFRQPWGREGEPCRSAGRGIRLHTQSYERAQRQQGIRYCACANHPTMYAVLWASTTPTSYLLLRMCVWSDYIRSLMSEHNANKVFVTAHVLMIRLYT